MPRPVYRRRWAWATGMHTSPQETILDVQSAGFALSSLADQGLLTTRQLADFQDATGLADLAWRVSWNRSALAEANEDYRSLLRRTHGFVVFMHGWSSSGAVWEHLPALVCAANPRLVALVPDLNGFGRSPFLSEVPAVEHCDPSAIMKAVTHWVETLGLRSGPRARRRRRVITFVGHSVGGAALFHFHGQGWHDNEFARCAVVPALLIGDDLRHEFYQALGVDLVAGRSLDELRSRLQSRLRPQVVDILVGAAGEATRAEHMHIFDATPRGTLAQTFYAMGSTSGALRIGNLLNFRVILANEDHLLDVSRMVNLLDGLGLAAHQIQVVRGDHFLFSAGNENRRLRFRNRELVLGEILHLHEVCRERQRP